MLAEAAGIAHSGHVVAASSFAIFAAGRSYEIIRNSIAYTNANVKVCATHGGITVGEDGASHQTFEDLALMRVIPGMTVINPADDLSAKALLRQIFEADGPAYARFSRSGLPVIYDEEKAKEVKVGKALTLREGSDLAIIATGLMVSAALEAAEALADKGVQARVIDMHTIKPLDEEAIVKAAEECGFIVTAEEHSVIGGLGSAVAESVAESCPVPVLRVGTEDKYGHSGKVPPLLEMYGLTPANIAEKARKAIALKK
jgi:transketolase